MPRAADAHHRTERNAAIRADRARGFSLRRIAELHGVSLALAHRLAGDVYITLPSRWHRARQPRPAPAPRLLGHLHRLLSSDFG